MTTTPAATAALAAALADYWAATPGLAAIGKLYPADAVPDDAELPRATFEIFTREVFSTSRSMGHDHGLTVRLHAHNYVEADRLAVAFHDAFNAMELPMPAGSRVTMSRPGCSARCHVRDIYEAELSYDLATVASHAMKAAA